MSISEELTDFSDARLSVVEKSLNETNTKAKFVSPFLQCLGWPVFEVSQDASVELEHKIKMGSKTARVDYAFLAEGAAKAFVEAKPQKKSLTDGHREQLKSYLRQRGVTWGLLTNGKSYELYKRKQSQRTPDELLVADCTLDELPDHDDVFGIISAESLISGQAETVSESYEIAHMAYKRTSENHDQIVTDVSDTIKSHIGDDFTDEISGRVDEFVTDLEDHFQSRTASLTVDCDAGSREPTSTERSPTETEFESEQAFWDTLETDLGLNKNDPEVLREGRKKQLTDLMEWMDSNGVFDECDHLVPYENGPKRYALNTEPVHKNGRDMEDPVEIGPKLWLETNWNHHIAVNLLEKFFSDINADEVV